MSDTKNQTLSCSVCGEPKPCDEHDCIVCGGPEPCSHNFDEESKKLGEIFSRMGTSHCAICGKLKCDHLKPHSLAALGFPQQGDFVPLFVTEPADKIASRLLKSPGCPVIEKDTHTIITKTPWYQRILMMIRSLGSSMLRPTPEPAAPAPVWVGECHLCGHWLESDTPQDPDQQAECLGCHAGLTEQGKKRQLERDAAAADRRIVGLVKAAIAELDQERAEAAKRAACMADFESSDRAVIAAIKAIAEKDEQEKAINKPNSLRCKRPGCNEAAEPGESLCHHCQLEAQEAAP